MANNRIYLKCNGCGGLLFLGKRFSDGYWWHNYGKDNHIEDEDNRPLEDRLNNFFDIHELCGIQEDGFTLDHFSISYEMDDDFVYIDGLKKGSENAEDSKL